MMFGVILVSLRDHIGHMLRPFWIFSISTCIDINSSKILDNLDKSVVIRVQKKTMFAHSMKK